MGFPPMFFLIRQSMYVIYWIYSIAGWIALALFLIYWAGVVRGERLKFRDERDI